MKLKHMITGMAVAAILTSTVISAFADDDSGKQAKLAAKAKITKDAATQIAQAKVPNGTLKESEIEKDDGKLVWSFDFTTPDSQDVTEVNVDALTGHVNSMEWETPEDQAKEKAEDANDKD